MKKNRAKHDVANGPSSRGICLHFAHPTAATVCVALTFNDWRPETTPMVRMGDGRWLKELILAPGVYEYRLVVDGEWMPDPRSSETVTNPFGEMNSVVRVNGGAS